MPCQNPDWRNTFIWTPTQYTAALNGSQLDYSKAKRIQWLHAAVTSTSRVVENVKEPLENRFLVAMRMRQVRRPARLRQAVAALLLVVFSGSCSRQLPIVEDAVASNVTTYRYDKADRLQSAKRGDGQTFKYTYDPNSNLISIRDKEAEHRYTYNDANALESGEYDDNGNPTRLDDAEYRWDTHDRLVEVKRAKTATTFSYDGQSHIVRIQETRDGKPSAD